MHVRDVAETLHSIAKQFNKDNYIQVILVIKIHQETTEKVEKMLCYRSAKIGLTE